MIFQRGLPESKFKIQISEECEFVPCPTLFVPVPELFYIQEND